MRKIVLLAPFVLAACGPDLETACQNYIDAVNGCVGEAYPDDAATYETDADVACAGLDGYHGAAAKAQADLFQCYADAYNDADCSTVDGYNAGTTTFTSCVGG